MQFMPQNHTHYIQTHNTHLLTNASTYAAFILPLPTSPSPPPPPPLLLIRLTPNLTLLLLLKHLDLATIPLILSHPILHKPTNILDEAFGAAIPHPQADDQDAAPKDKADSEVDPEDDGAVHHVEDLERDEEDEEQRDDGGDIGLCDELVEQRREVCG